MVINIWNKKTLCPRTFQVCIPDFQYRELCLGAQNFHPTYLSLQTELESLRNVDKAEVITTALL